MNDLGFTTADRLTKDIQKSSEELIRTNQHLLNTSNTVLKDNQENRAELFGTEALNLDTLKKRFGETTKQNPDETDENYQQRLQLQYEAKVQEQIANSVATYPALFLMEYFDENTASEFALNKGKDISMAHNDLVIQGLIKGETTLLRYQLSPDNGNPNLEINDFLDHKENDFSFSLHNFKSTGYDLPAQTKINEELKETYKNTQKDLLNTGNFEDVQKALGEKFQDSTHKLFPDKEHAQLAMERQVRKDVASQKLIPLLKASEKKSDYNISEEVKKNPDLKDFLRYRDNVLETASINEVQRCTNIIEKLTTMSAVP
jgi:hypothetical protein